MQFSPAYFRKNKESPPSLDSRASFFMLERVHPKFRRIKLTTIFTMKALFSPKAQDAGYAWNWGYVETGNVTSLNRMTPHSADQKPSTGDMTVFGGHTMIMVQESHVTSVSNTSKIGNENLRQYLKSFFGYNEFSSDWNTIIEEFEIGSKFLGGFLFSKKNYQIVAVTFLADWLRIHQIQVGCIGNSPIIIGCFCLFRDLIPLYDANNFPREYIQEFILEVQNLLGAKFAIIDFDNQTHQPLINELLDSKKSIAVTQELYSFINLEETPFISMKWPCRFLDLRHLSSLLFFQENNLDFRKKNSARL